MIKLITPGIDSMMSKKPLVQQLPQIHTEGNSELDESVSSPTNRRALGVNHIFPRKLPSARSQRTYVQLIPLHPISNNVDPAKRVPSRQAAPNSDTNSNETNDSAPSEHPLKAIKHQPKILNNAHLPSVFTNEKARAPNSNLREHIAHPPNKIQYYPSEDLCDFVPRPSKSRESVRRIPAKNRCIWNFGEDANPIVSKSHAIDTDPKKHIAIFKKLMSKFSDATVENAQKNSGHPINFLDHYKHPSPRVNSKISLSEMITLKKIQAQSQGITKRMLHVPTLNIYDIQEEPIRASEGFKEWITQWKTSFNRNENKYLQKIYTVFWNSPEGYVSILKESAKNGTLQDVLDQYNTIPENCIKNIASNLLKGLSDVHSFMQQAHGALDPSEIIFDSNCGAKLSAGVSHQLAHSKFEDSQLQTFRGNAKEESSGKDIVIRRRASSIETLPKKPDLSFNNPNQHKQPLSADTFDLGYLLLTCALGNLDFFDISGFYSQDNLKSLLDTIHSQQRKIRNACCLLHSEEELRKIHSELTHTKKLRGSDQKVPLTNNFHSKPSISQDSNQASSKKISLPFTLLDLLTKSNRFSDSFIDFLCHCLRIEPNAQSYPETLLDHEFLSQTHASSGPLTSIRELISNLTMQRELETSTRLNGEHLDRVCDAIKLVLLNPDTKEKMLKLTAGKIGDSASCRTHLKISELAAELGVPLKKALEKFRGEIFTGELSH